MRTPTLSIVIPMYNTERTLHRCVDSILAQTFTDFELLLVNDGSKDKSAEICDEYAQKDSRIRVFHKKNGGVTSARKTGVEKAQGEWMLFVDADDALPHTDVLQIWMNHAVGNNYDILIGRKDTKSYGIDEISAEKNCSYAVGSDLFLPCAPWARLIRRSLFDVETFNIPREIIQGEDALMNIRLAFKNEKPVKLVSEHLYCYTENTDGATSKFKDSIDYETLYDKYRMQSIPEEARSAFATEIASTRINGLIILFMQQGKNTWRNTKFYADIIDDIEKYHCRLKTFHRLFINTHNECLLSILVGIKRLRGWMLFQR